MQKMSCEVTSVCGTRPGLKICVFATGLEVQMFLIFYQNRLKPVESRSHQLWVEAQMIWILMDILTTQFKCLSLHKYSELRVDAELKDTHERSRVQEVAGCGVD